jgi:protein phosphatase
MVDDDTIFAIISKAQTPESACNQLINQANNAGGRDNITAVILKVD